MSSDKNPEIQEAKQQNISIKLDAISLQFSNRLSGSAIQDRVCSETKIIKKCKITR